MASKKENVITPEFRVSYPHMFTPRLNDMNKKMEYSVVALFKKGEDIKPLRSEALRAVKEKWGSEPKKWPKKMMDPFRDQGEREKTGADGDNYLPDGYEVGAFFVNFKTDQRPGLIDGKRQPIIDETEFYPGCYARASVRAFAWEAKGDKGVVLKTGVSFWLVNVQKTRDGEPFSGNPKAEDEFSAVESTDTPFDEGKTEEVNPFS